MVTKMITTSLAGLIHPALRCSLVVMLGIALRGVEPELPNFHFLTGSSIAPLRLNHALPGVDVRLGEGDVILIDAKIVRVSLLDLLDVDDRQVFPEDENLYKGIKFLSVINCRVKQRIPEYIANLAELVHLDLSKNGMIGNIDSLSFPKKLRFLSLSNNAVQGSINRMLVELPHLEFLNIGDTELDIDPALIAQSKFLNTVTFYFENIKSPQADWENKLQSSFSIYKMTVKRNAENTGSDRLFYSVIRKETQDKIDGRPTAEVMEELRKLYISDQK